jgi:uncharacterized DUF497 family protein
MLNFEWDIIKAKANINKHNITFEEASTVFNDMLSITFPDTFHSLNEDRYIILGVTRLTKLLVISHTYRNGNVRIISARAATKKEKLFYENSK